MPNGSWKRRRPSGRSQHRIAGRKRPAGAPARACDRLQSTMLDRARALFQAARLRRSLAVDERERLLEDFVRTVEGRAPADGGGR